MTTEFDDVDTTSGVVDIETGMGMLNQVPMHLGQGKIILAIDAVAMYIQIRLEKKLSVSTDFPPKIKELFRLFDEILIACDSNLINLSEIEPQIPDKRELNLQRFKILDAILDFHQLVTGQTNYNPHGDLLRPLVWHFFTYIERRPKIIFNKSELKLIDGYRNLSMNTFDGMKTFEEFMRRLRDLVPDEVINKAMEIAKRSSHPTALQNVTAHLLHSPMATSLDEVRSAIEQGECDRLPELIQHCNELTVEVVREAFSLLLSNDMISAFCRVYAEKHIVPSDNQIRQVYALIDENWVPVLEDTQETLEMKRNVFRAVSDMLVCRTMLDQFFDLHTQLKIDPHQSTILTAKAIAEGQDNQKWIDILAERFQT